MFNISKITRANNPNKTLQFSALQLLDTMFKFFLQGKKELIFNHDYIRKFTKCASTRHNIRILGQLSNIVFLKYHKKIVRYNAKLNREESIYDVYVITLTEEGKRILGQLTSFDTHDPSINFDITAKKPCKSSSRKINTRLKKSDSSSAKMSANTTYIYNDKDIIDINSKNGYPKYNVDFKNKSQNEHFATSELVKDRMKKLDSDSIKLVNRYCKKFTSVENMQRSLSFEEKRGIFGYMVTHVVEWGLQKIRGLSLFEKVRKALNVFWKLFKEGKFKIPVSYQIAKEIDFEYAERLKKEYHNGTKEDFSDLRLKAKSKLGIELKTLLSKPLELYNKVSKVIKPLLKPATNHFKDKSLNFTSEKYIKFETTEDGAMVKIEGKHLMKMLEMTPYEDGKVSILLEKVYEPEFLQAANEFAKSKIVEKNLKRLSND